MSAKNIFHDTVIQALMADGWTITHDPLRISYGGRELYVDLGLEEVTLGAVKAGRRIAVEVQSFQGPSPVHDLEVAVGQYEIYRILLAELDVERVLYLGVPSEAHENLFSERLGQLIVNRLHLRLLVFDEVKQKVIQWIN